VGRRAGKCEGANCTRESGGKVGGRCCGAGANWKNEGSNWTGVPGRHAVEADLEGVWGGNSRFQRGKRSLGKMKNKGIH